MKSVLRRVSEKYWRFRLAPRTMVAAMTLLFWAQAAVLFAQRRGKNLEEAAPPAKSYVVSYMVVVLCIALGLLVVCRSGGRSNEPPNDTLD